MPSSLIWFDHIPLNYVVMDNGIFFCGSENAVFQCFQLEFRRDSNCNNTWYFRKRIFWNLAPQPPVRAPKVVLKKIKIPKHVGIPVKCAGAKKIWWNSSPVHIFGYLKKTTYSGPLLDHSWTTFEAVWTTFWTIAGPQLLDAQNHAKRWPPIEVFTPLAAYRYEAPSELL